MSQKVHFKTPRGEAKCLPYENLDRALNAVTELAKKGYVATSLENEWGEHWSNPAELAAIAKLRSTPPVQAQLEALPGFGTF